MYAFNDVRPVYPFYHLKEQLQNMKLDFYLYFGL